MAGTLADITPSGQSRLYVDTTESCLVKASDLYTRLASLHSVGELDGGLPLSNHVLVGFLTAPDLAYALDQMLGKDSDEDIRCLLVQDERYDVAVNMPNVVDLRHIDDSAPIGLDIHSSLELVYECFAKLGLRQICVLKDGKYHGMLSAKVTSGGPALAWLPLLEGALSNNHYRYIRRHSYSTSKGKGRTLARSKIRRLYPYIYKSRYYASSTASLST